MTFEILRFGDVAVLYDRIRIPLSSMERAKRQGQYRYYGAQGVIDHVDDYLFDGTYLLIAEDGENLKSNKQNIAQIVTGQFWVNNHAHIVQTTERCNLQYLCYLLNLMDISGYITGSAQPKLSQANLNAIELSLPSREHQDQIVTILRLLDNKIELNNQISENLEQQARTLYRQWLISKKDEITKCLSEIANVNTELYSSKEKWPFVNYLDTSSITSGTISEIQYIVPSEDKLPSRARRIIRQGDIVFSTVRPNQLHYGIVSNPLPNMLGSTGFAVIRSNSANIPNEIIYLALTEPAFVEQMQQLAEQSVSTFPSIRPSDLDACILPEPAPEDADCIEAIKSLFKVISINSEENQRLSIIRDTLLPKLVSGELDVSEIDL